MTTTTNDYFGAKARWLFMERGLDPALAEPLAGWARAAVAQVQAGNVGVEKAKVLVDVTDGSLIASTVFQPGTGPVSDATYIDQLLVDLPGVDQWDARRIGRTEIGLAKREIEKALGHPAMLVSYWDACKGPAVILPEGDPITTRIAAQIAGVSESTWRAYVNRGDAGVPDPAGEVMGRPVYERQQVIDWVASRPGPGNRTRR